MEWKRPRWRSGPFAHPGESRANRTADTTGGGCEEKALETQRSAPEDPSHTTAALRLLLASYEEMGKLDALGEAVLPAPAEGSFRGATVRVRPSRRAATESPPQRMH